MKTWPKKNVKRYIIRKVKIKYKILNQIKKSLKKNKLIIKLKQNFVIMKTKINLIHKILIILKQFLTTKFKNINKKKNYMMKKINYFEDLNKKNLERLFTL